MTQAIRNSAKLHETYFLNFICSLCIVLGFFVGEVIDLSAKPLTNAP